MTKTDLPLGIDMIPADTRPQCESGITIQGEFFRCEYTQDHDGWSHASKKAKAIWK